MAITTATGTPMAGVNYTVMTDTSADWSAVANNVYFYDKQDKLVHYKSGGGTVLEVFAVGGLTIGTTAIASGTIGRILFEATGNVLQQDSTLFWDNTNKRLGIGATPSSTVRLDIRAQGALSTDIAFRVRNSADSADLFNVLGNGRLGIGIASPATALNVEGLIKIGTGTMVYPAATGFQAFSSTANAALGVDLTNAAGGGYSQLLLAETTGEYGTFIRWNSAYPGNYTGTSVAYANTFQIQSGNSNNKGFMISASPFTYQSGATSSNFGMRADATGLRLGTLADIHTSPTAVLHIKAGTATASTAPLKLTSGTNLTTPENGAIEFDGTNIFITVGGVRKTFTIT